jgi:hypothetical protein
MGLSNRTNQLLLYAFFWIIPRHMNFIYQHFGPLCLFCLHSRVGMKNDWGRECWGIYTGKGLAQNSLSQSEGG